jgi:KipI family sensor histidine kinase inhibitor
MNGPYPRFLDAGEAALVVEFGDRVDAEINERVLALDRAVAGRALAGVRETVPTYRSLMIHYDPLRIERAMLAQAVMEMLPTLSAASRSERALWTIPCCYDPEFAEDIAEIAAQTGLTPERVAALHAGATYRIAMYGFAPGFCYLGGLPPELAISRRVTPRAPHPPNTILLGGGMTLISTFSMPTGWWLVGRTPERMFATGRDPAFFAEVGDGIRFAPVARAEFDALAMRVAAGEMVAKRESRS